LGPHQPSTRWGRPKKRPKVTVDALHPTAVPVSRGERCLLQPSHLRPPPAGSRHRTGDHPARWRPPLRRTAKPSFPVGPMALAKSGNPLAYLARRQADGDRGSGWERDRPARDIKVSRMYVQRRLQEHIRNRFAGPSIPGNSGRFPPRLTANWRGVSVSPLIFPTPRGPAGPLRIGFAIRFGKTSSRQVLARPRWRSTAPQIRNASPANAKDSRKKVFSHAPSCGHALG